MSAPLGPRLALLLVALLAGSCSGPDGETGAGLSGAARGWNVLLVSVDTLRADRLGAYGYSVRDSSPYLDRWMATGVRFDRASAPRALTWPSLASVVTGLYPRSHGVTQNGYSFTDDVSTLPRLLEAEGYQTAAFLGNMCKANHLGWGRRSCVKDPEMLEKVRTWVDGMDEDRPFLLWTHYFGAHDPFHMGGDLASELDPGYEGPVESRKGKLNRLMEERIELDEADLRHLGALYDAAVMKTDHRIAQLFRLIERSGRWPRTLVVLVADHGEELLEHHGYLYHACSVYQGALRVPLAFAAPGLLPEGAVVRQPVELVDVAPTLLDLLAIEATAAVDGVSLVPYLEGRQRPDGGRPAFSEWPGTGLHTVVAGGWKLIDNPQRFRPHCFEGAPADFFALEEVELYDLANDPGEHRNLASEHPERVAELRELIRRRFAGVRDRSRRQEVPSELQEELRALGYLAGTEPGG